MTQARLATLHELERLREHREQLTQRALQFAREAEERAEQQLAHFVAAQRALEADIVATTQRPFGTPGREQVPMIEVQRSLRRVEWLAEQLVEAKSRVRAAQAALLEKTALRRDALRVHLLARAKREAVQEQRVRALRVALAGAERRQLEEAQERAHAAPAPAH